jgi:hypothetical protein
MGNAFSTKYFLGEAYALYFAEGRNVSETPQQISNRNERVTFASGARSRRVRGKKSLLRGSKKGTPSCRIPAPKRSPRLCAPLQYHQLNPIIVPPVAVDCPQRGSQWPAQTLNPANPVQYRSNTASGRHFLHNVFSQGAPFDR